MIPVDEMTISLSQGDRGFRGEKGKKGDRGESGEAGATGPLVLDFVSKSSHGNLTLCEQLISDNLFQITG